jgi:hypothetical protein
MVNWQSSTLSYLLVVSSCALASEPVLTVRLGEQDTCRITGVTTVQSQKDSATIRFDVSKIKAPRKAILRLWVDLEGNAPFGKTFNIDRWNVFPPAFDGFKVWDAGKEETRKLLNQSRDREDRRELAQRRELAPLAVSFPFAFSSPVCHEWDVTAAVQAWVADPEANKGLRTNFALPAAGFEPAWQRPYLEVTCAGQGRGLGFPASGAALARPDILRPGGHRQAHLDSRALD